MKYKKIYNLDKERVNKKIMVNDRENDLQNELPKIIIVGRPNVGKSTLFNRLIKYRHSIVYSTPGVTRDKIEKITKYDNFEFKLMDTGGITVENDDDFKSHIRRQCEIAFNEADVVIFLVDIDGVTTDEEYITEKLRKSKKPVILTVNKIDNEKRLQYVSEFYKLGFGEPIPISAEHNLNIDVIIDNIKNKLRLIGKLKETEIGSSGYGQDNAKDKIDIEESSSGYSQRGKNENIINVSIIGKPNTGKSSLLNKMLGYERSIVTDVAGTTRDTIEESIYFRGKKIFFVDTAGIRRKSKIEEDIEYLSVKRSIDSVKKSSIVLLMIDSIENISQQDKKIADIAVKNGKAFLIILNKWDLMDKDVSFEEYKNWIKFRFAVASYVPVIKISALTGKGVKSLLETVVQINVEYNKRVTTAELNKWVEIVTNHHTLSMKGQNFKIYYGTQVSTAPPCFVFFVNKIENIPESYKKYLINNLREAFGFTGVPIKINFKKHN